MRTYTISKQEPRSTLKKGEKSTYYYHIEFSNCIKIETFVWKENFYQNIMCKSKNIVIGFIS